MSMHGHKQSNNSRRYKQLLALLLLCLVAVGAGVALYTHTRQPAYQAPGQSFTRAEAFHLENLRGSVVYLDFWASWCAPCRESFPWMERMAKRYHNQGLRIVAVNLDPRVEDMHKFLDQVGGDFPIVLNPSFSMFREHKLLGLPSAIVFDRHGRQVQVDQGFTRAQAAEREALLQQLLG